jgi:hypothetical protein
MRAFAALSAFLLTLSIGASTLAAQAPASGLAQATGIDKITAYSGSWKITIEHLDTPFSKAGKETTNLHNDCWRSGEYFACNQIVDGDSKVLIVFTYNAKDDSYTSYPIQPGGGPAGHGKLTIQGNTWTFPWEDTDGGKPVYFRVVNVFTSPTTIEYRQEFSRDKVQWTATARGSEQKQP